MLQNIESVDDGNALPHPAYSLNFYLQQIIFFTDKSFYIQDQLEGAISVDLHQLFTLRQDVYVFTQPLCHKQDVTQG